MKKCSKCKQYKSLKLFYDRKDKKDGKASECKQCRKKYDLSRRNETKLYQREWRKKNPGKAYGYVAKYKYGITKEEYEFLFKKQKGKCKICNKKEQLKWTDGKIKRLAIDHCHETGKIRGLICNGCNRAIGYMHNDPIIAKQIAEYLKEDK